MLKDNSNTTDPSSNLPQNAINNEENLIRNDHSEQSMTAKWHCPNDNWLYSEFKNNFLFNNEFKVPDTHVSSSWSFNPPSCSFHDEDCNNEPLYVSPTEIKNLDDDSEMTFLEIGAVSDGNKKSNSSQFRPWLNQSLNINHCESLPSDKMNLNKSSVIETIVTSSSTHVIQPNSLEKSQNNSNTSSIDFIPNENDPQKIIQNTLKESVGALHTFFQYEGK